MIFIIICAVALGICAYTNFYEIEDLLLGVFLGLMLGFFIWLSVGIPIGIAVPKTEVVEKQEICALTDSSSIEGRKFLFSGYIDEELVYRYVVNTDRGKQVEEVKNDNVFIKEGDYQPSVIKHKFVPKSDWYYWFCIPVCSYKNYTEFLVPENTITTKYNIDLE